MAIVDIELYYDLDRRRWTTSAGGLATQPSLFIGQSNTIDFKVRFVQGGVPIELTNPSFIAGVKVTDDPLGDYLLLTTTGTQTGNGPTTIYTFTLNIDSVELQAYLVGITPTTNSTAFEVRDTVNNIATLPAITCSILPDYTLTGATPAAGSGTLVVDSGATFTVHKSFAMPTTDGFDNYVLKTNGAGVGSWVADNAGTGTVTSVGLSVAGGGTVLSITGTPVTSSGTLGIIVAGTSGGLLYFSSGNTMGSTATLGLGALVVGGGAGGVPTALAAVASGRVLTSAGTLTNPAYSSTITLGASGTLGTITLGNATSGTILITPPTGSLGTLTITLPNVTTTLAGLAVAQTFSANQTFSGTIEIAATTSTAGQITQGGAQFIHSYGTDNLFLGAAGNATLANMSGTGLNLAIGKLALSGATTTSGNVAIGKGALRLITTSASNNNVVIGIQCADNTADLIETIAIGTNCQRSIASNSATAIGVSANCGSYSVAIGHQALNGTTAGSVACTAVGRRSLLLATGERNTACGHEAGSTITSGTYNTLLGDSAQTGSATAIYRTAIGSGATANINNSIKLGRDILDVVVLPKMTTTERGTYGTPVAGSLIFNTTTGKLNVYSGTAWEAVTSA